MSEQRSEDRKKCNYCRKSTTTTFSKEVVYRYQGHVKTATMVFCDQRCYGNYQMSCEG